MSLKIAHFQPICLALFLVFFVLMATLTLARPVDYPKLSLNERHDFWMANHRRVYKDLAEKKFRFNIFTKNVDYIENFNSNTSSSKLFKLGVNAFSDLTTEEFIATYTGYKRPFGSKSKFDYPMKMEYKHPNFSQLDTSPFVDWRKNGAVTAIKNQGNCACCWAFSSVAAVEGLNQIKTGQLISLSEQQLLDCVIPNNGCEGGSLESTFDFIHRNQGIVKEEEYAYKGYQTPCHTTKGGAVTINGYQGVPQNDEVALLKVVSLQPVSVGVSLSDEFWSYKGGVFNGQCGNNAGDITHAVTIIGYGAESDGSVYWLVKNSWGESWGEGGYMKIIRDKNQCAISLDAYYPI